MTFHRTSDAAGINKALFEVTHGMYILTARDGERMNGQVLDAMMQVTNNPPRVAVGVGKRNFTHGLIEATGKFFVNVIDRMDATWHDKVRHFGFQSGRNVDKFNAIPFRYEQGQSGLPLLIEAKAFFGCRVIPEMTVDLGTHTLFIGFVEESGVCDAGEPLTYAEYRRATKRPSSPVTEQGNRPPLDAK